MAEALIHLTDDNFKGTVQKGVTLVDCTASWCGPCRMIAPIVDALANELNGKAQVGKLDVDEAQETASALQITSVPTLILYKDGKELKRVVGVKDIDFLRNLVTEQI